VPPAERRASPSKQQMAARKSERKPNVGGEDGPQPKLKMHPEVLLKQ